MCTLAVCIRTPATLLEHSVPENVESHINFRKSLLDLASVISCRKRLLAFEKSSQKAFHVPPETVLPSICGQVWSCGQVVNMSCSSDNAVIILAVV